MRRSLWLLVLLAVLASACSRAVATRAELQPREYGTVIGSLVVQLERTPRSAWDGFFEENLARRKPDYRFHFANAERAWNVPRQPVDVDAGEPKPFVIALRPGAAALEELELVIYDSPGSWPLGLISATDGRSFPLGLEFDVDPERITYIGRVRVVLPNRLQLFGSKARVVVEDAAEEDYGSMETLIELSNLPVATVLAQQGATE